MPLLPSSLRPCCRCSSRRATGAVSERPTASKHCCEGGPPIEVDPATLHTRGEHLFGEGLPMGFSAHAKIDEADGCLCAFPSFTPLLNLKS